MFFLKAVLLLILNLATCWAGSIPSTCVLPLLSTFNVRELVAQIELLANQQPKANEAHSTIDHSLVYFVGEGAPPEWLASEIPGATNPKTAADFWMVRDGLLAISRMPDTGTNPSVNIYGSERLSNLRSPDYKSCGQIRDYHTNRLISGCFNGLLNMAMLSVLVLQPIPNKEFAVASLAVRFFASLAQFVIDVVHPNADNRALRLFSKLNLLSAVTNVVASSGVPSVGIGSALDVFLTRYRNRRTRQINWLQLIDATPLERLERYFSTRYEQGNRQPGTFIWSLRKGSEHFLMLISAGEENRAPAWFGALWTSNESSANSASTQ